MRVLTRMVRGGGAQKEDAEDERAIERSYTLLPAALPRCRHPFLTRLTMRRFVRLIVTKIKEQKKTRHKHTNANSTRVSEAADWFMGRWTSGLPER